MQEEKDWSGKVLPLCLTACLVAVLFFNSLGGGDFFVVSRSAVVAAGVILLFACVLWWGLSFRPARIRPLWLIVALLPGFIISARVSDHMLMSVVGSADRGQGVLMYMIYLLWFVLLLVVLGGRVDPRLFLWLFLACGLLLVAFALLEFLATSVFGWWQPLDIGLQATLGHPAVLAGFILFLLPLTGAAWLVCRSGERSALLRAIPVAGLRLLLSGRSGDLFFFCFLTLQLFVLFFTQTRGAWLALLAMGALAAFRLQKIRLRLLGITALLMIFFGLVLSGFYTRHIVDVSSGTGLLRLVWWDNVLASGRIHTVFGHGPETAADFLAEQWQPLEARLEAFSTHADRFHNEYIDFLWSFGWYGLAVYGLFFLFIIVSAGRRLRFLPQENRVLVSGIFLALGGHLVASVFIFSGTVIYFLQWTFLALAWILTHPSLLSSPGIVFSWLRRLLAPLIVVLAWYYYIAAPLVSGLMAANISEVQQANPRFLWQTYQTYQPWLEVTGFAQPGQAHWRLFLSRSFSQLVAASGDIPVSAPLLAESKHVLEQERVSNGVTPLWLQSAGYALLADASERDVHDDMQQLFREERALTPLRPEMYLRYSALWQQLGDYNEARRQLRLARVAAPRVLAAQDYDFPWIFADVKKIQEQVWLQQGLLSLAEGREKEAIQSLRQALPLSSDPGLVYHAFSRGWEARDSSQALQLNQQALRFSPDNVVFLTDGMRLLETLGRDDEALVVARRILTLDPYHFAARSVVP